jgi:hypothetical protein
MRIWGGVLNPKSCVLGALLLPLAGVAGAAGKATLTMHVVPTVLQDGDVSLQFHLRYVGEEAFEADQGSIASGRGLRIALDATRFPDYDNNGRSGPCVNLEEIITVNDPDSGFREVKPGEEFVEVIRLSEQYHGVKEVLGQCELVVNWSYKMYTQDKVRFPRLAGSVVVPSSLRPVPPPDVTVQGTSWKYEPLPRPDK